METPTVLNIVGIAASLAAIFFGAFGIFRNIAGIESALRTLINSESDKTNLKIESVEKSSRLLTEAFSEREAKSRHDLSNSVMGALSDMRRDTKALDDKINTMRSEMIRRSDLNEARADIMTGLDRQDRMRTDAMDKLEKARGDAFDKLEKRIEMLVVQGVSDATSRRS